MIIDIKSTTLGGYSDWRRLDTDDLDPHPSRYVSNLLVQAEVSNLPPELLADLREDTDESCYVLYIEGEGGSQTMKIRRDSMTEPLQQLMDYVIEHAANRGAGTWEDLYRQQRTRGQLQMVIARLVQQLPPGFNQNVQLTQFLAGELLDLTLNWERLQSQPGQTTDQIMAEFERRLARKARRLIRTGGPLKLIR